VKTKSRPRFAAARLSIFQFPIPVIRVLNRRPIDRAILQIEHTGAFVHGYLESARALRELHDEIAQVTHKAGGTGPTLKSAVQVLAARAITVDTKRFGIEDRCQPVFGVG
jgi:hypothetical protein